MALNINGTTGISGVDGSASAPALQGTDSNTGINFASDTVNINTGGSTRATVDSSGNLGIGTASPSTILHCSSSSNTGIFAQSTNSGSSVSTNYQTPNRIFYTGIDIGGTNSSYTIYDGTAGAERMRIDSTGNLLIHCTSSSGSDGRIYTNKADANQTVLEVNQNNGSGSEMITFRNGGSQIGQITQSGSGVAYGTSSDYRLKENDVAISDGITRIKQLRPIKFNFKTDTKTTLDGFFAHEVQAIVPEAVTGEKDAVFTAKESGVGNDVEGEIKSQALDQSKLVPLLTAALQEAVAKIEVLETKVAALEAG